MVAVVLGCSGTPDAGQDEGSAEPAASSPSPPRVSPTRPTPTPTPTATPTATQAPTATPTATQAPTATPTATQAPTATPRSVPEPRRSFVSIPALGLREVPTVRYRGRPDDGPGTRIQNGGAMASPRGPRGGVGPGEVGNFIVTGHRTSHGAPLAELPDLGPGDRVEVRSAKRVFVYRVTRTRSTSFRSAESLARQVAPVPGRPGATARRPMLTLSTCATPEDHAAGNYWSDRFDNPEHRIDKIGVLVRVRPAG